MRLAGITPGDLVVVDHKGRVFLALVTARKTGELSISPARGSGATYHRAAARDVVAHYKHRGETVHRHVITGTGANG